MSTEYGPPSLLIFSSCLRELSAIFAYTIWPDDVCAGIHNVIWLAGACAAAERHRGNDMMIPSHIWVTIRFFTFYETLSNAIRFYNTLRFISPRCLIRKITHNSIHLTWMLNLLLWTKLPHISTLLLSNTLCVPCGLLYFLWIVQNTNSVLHWTHTLTTNVSVEDNLNTYLTGRTLQ